MYINIYIILYDSIILRQDLYLGHRREGREGNQREGDGGQVGGQAAQVGEQDQ